MNVFITGASGYIGHKLALLLASEGVTVHALIRDENQKRWLIHPNIKLYRGDILNIESLSAAIINCQQVYHTAAKVGAWASDPSLFYTVNVEGTHNVLKAAQQAGVEKLVFTSTSGLYGPSEDVPLNEEAVRKARFTIDYDRSKKEAEDVVLNYASKGMNAVTVSPSKVFGPGHTSHSLTTNAIIDAFLQKKFTFIPSPGTYKVCFAYINDIVEGHVLAMQKGRSGERYILGGHNVSYYGFFHCIRTLAASNARIIPLPKRLIKLWAHLQEARFKLVGTDVRFPVSSVDHVFNNYIFSSKKAITELGYKITPLDEAIRRTLEFLNHRPYE